MKKVEPDHEALELAIRREREAHNFYLALAAKIENPPLCKILKDLAKEELEHKAKLEMEFMKNGIVVNTTAKENSFQISDYVVADEPITDMDIRDLLEICIQKEDASFRFYADLLLQAKDNNTKETCLSLMEEEIKHKLRFENEYDDILKTR